MYRVGYIKKKHCSHGTPLAEDVFSIERKGGFLGGGFKHFLLSPLFGEDSHYDEHIFQMGWFNHQPDLNLFESHSFPYWDVYLVPWKQS